MNNKHSKLSFLARAAMTLAVLLLTSMAAWAQNPASIGSIQWNSEGYYEIKSGNNLHDLAVYVNGQGTYSTGGDETTRHNAIGLTFKQTANIDMENETFAPIGNYHENGASWGDPSFQGTYNGGEFEIRNLTISNSTDWCQGLFGYLYGSAVVKNVKLVNCSITTGQRYAGGIVAFATASSNNRITIDNCHFNGTLTNSLGSGSGSGNYHGGIAGNIQDTDISNCTVTGTISTTKSSYYYGGIVGYARTSTVSDCENQANITGTGRYYGGIVGENYSSTISNCFSIGTIEGDGRGAIAGSNLFSYGTFSNCYYASPCNVKAVNNSDIEGVVPAYTITNGTNVAAIAITEPVNYHSTLTGKDYFVADTYTVTMTLTPDMNTHTLDKYICEGGTLTLDTENNVYKLTITDKDVTISALVHNNDANPFEDLITIEDIPNQRWMGKVAIVPVVNVKYDNTTLVEGTDYYMEVANNEQVGQATVTITGINGYTGTKQTTFNIEDLTVGNNNRYQISSEADLQQFASIVNTGGRLNGVYELTDDITLTQEHTPIGCDGDHCFKGSFDGNDHTISNLTINQPNKSYQGLFGYISNSDHVFYVTLSNCNIKGKEYVGGIAGYAAEANIYGCKVSGTIEGNNAGGIVGYNYSSSYLRSCFSACEVSGTSNVGSIVGNCSNTNHFSNNYHLSTTIGGKGEYNKATGTDIAGKAEVVVKITNGDERITTFTLPATPAVTWNEENYYKSGTEVILNCTETDGNYFDYYNVSNGAISNAGIIDGSHTLTGFTEDVVITPVYVTSQTDLSTLATIASIEALPYNGAVQHPVPVVTYNNETLVENVNYTVSYSADCQNVGTTHTVTVNFIGKYTGSTSAQFTINPYNISVNNAITVTDFEGEYPKGYETIGMTLKMAGTNITLTAGTDYDVTDNGNHGSAGNYQLTINAKDNGNYVGTMSLDYTIVDTSTLTVYDGTDRSNIPVIGNDANCYNKTEFVMPASKLTNMNGKAITTMKFYVETKAAADWGDARWRVFMKEVDYTTIQQQSNYYVYEGSDGATIVYDGALDGTQNVMTVSFTVPYIYKGGNLLIGFYQYERGMSKDVLFYGENQNEVVCYYSDSPSHEYYSVDNITTGYDKEFLPKTTFWYQDKATVDVKFAPEGFATYFDSQLDLVLPEGMKARIVTADEGNNKLTYADIADGDKESKIVPAGTAVMLQIAKGSEPQTKTIGLDRGAAAFTGTNLLHGSDTETTPTGNSGDLFYKLTYSDSGNNFGWYWGATDGAAFTSPAHKAWLVLSANSARGFLGLPDYNDELTGIADINREAVSDGRWYSVDGVRQNGKPTKKGLFIVDGKKVVIK